MGRDAVATPETGVEDAGRRVASQREVLVPGSVGVSAEQDLAVGRDDHLGRLFGAAEVGDGNAVAATERGVHGPGGRQAGYRPVVAGVSADDDLPVGLQVHAVQVVDSPHVEDVDAVAAEARVQCAGRRVAGDEEVVGPGRVRGAGHEDLAVVLDVDGGDELAAAAGVVYHLAAGTEARVQRAVRRVHPGQCQVPAVRTRRVHPAANEDLVVGLERTRVALFVVGSAELDELLPVSGEGVVPERVGSAHHHDAVVVFVGVGGVRPGVADEGVAAVREQQDLLSRVGQGAPELTVGLGAV